MALNPSALSSQTDRYPFERPIRGHVKEQVREREEEEKGEEEEEEKRKRGREL
jgi:hypothetical protein